LTLPYTSLCAGEARFNRSPLGLEMNVNNYLNFVKKIFYTNFLMACRVKK